MHLKCSRPCSDWRETHDIFDLYPALDAIDILDAPDIHQSHPFERKVGEVGGVLETTQEALKSAIHVQIICSKNIKALHKPLQTIPRSIHPIESTP